MAGNLTQFQWVPPPIEVWNLTKSCSAYARFVSPIFRRSDKIDVPDVCVFDVYSLYEYVASSLPSTFQESDQNFTTTQTATWYLSVCERPANGTWSDRCQEDDACRIALAFQDEIRSMMYQDGSDEGACLEELRSSLDVKGNADMAGIGVSRMIRLQLEQNLTSGQVMASFCIEAFLIISFIIAYAISLLRRNRAPPSRGMKITDAFRAVLPNFYLSSVLFSLGIIVAALKTSVEALRGGQADQLARWRKAESNYSPYDAQLAAMASLFSSLPPFMAGILLRQLSRRGSMLNAIMLSFLAVIPIPLVVIHVSIGSENRPNGGSATYLFDRLLYRDAPVIQLYALAASFSLALAMLIGWIVLICYRKRCGSPRVPSGHSTCILVSTGLFQVVLLAVMIIALVIFFSIRAELINAGDNSQLDWSFGQILALTTWIPVVIDFIYIMCGKYQPLGPILLSTGTD